MARAPVSIVRTMTDPLLFEDWFKDLENWKSWFAFLHTLFAIPMNKEQMEIYTTCTGRKIPPSQQFHEAWLCVGRRGGKSLVLALIAVYLAVFKDYKPFLSPGERATIMIIAADRRQARVIFRYIEAFLKQTKLLTQASLISRETSELFELKNQVSIEIHTASFRTIRGYAIAAALLDEVAFWRNEDSTNPDYEIIRALEPGMTTIPSSMILAASSPYARRGVLFDNYKKHYGTENKNILVWKAPTWVMNPTIPQEYFDEKYQEDPANAAAEYGAEFRSDVETFIPLEVLEACVDDGIYERRAIGEYDYVAFTDPSGGSKDSFTLGIAHQEENEVVLDLVMDRKPPFSPDEVVDEYCRVIKEYGLSSVTGDRYGGEWPRERFAAHDVLYQVCKMPKSEIYRELLPLLNGKEANLLDNNSLIQQLVNLERRTSRGGRDTIDHPPGGHDDIANAAAGALVFAKGREPIELW